MANQVQSAIRTLGDVLSMMAPFAGGSIPDENDTEYGDWVRWIQQKQEEYARRGFWRRCLTRVEITLSVGSTTVLPARFHKPNGIFVLAVPDDDGDYIDWNEPNNESEQTIFVEMVTDPSDDDYGSWQMRFGTALTEEKTAILWYFSNPAVPTEATDILLLPGDLVGYGALVEYFRTANQEGSMDKAEEDAENRLQEYLSLEMLPSKNELLNFSSNPKNLNRLAVARARYSSRRNRNNTLL